MHIHVPAHALLYMSVISYTWVWLLVKILYFDSRTLVPKVDVDWENMTLVQKGRGWAVQSGRGWRGCRGRWPGLLKGHSISTLCRYMTFERCIGLKRRTRRPKYIPIPNEAAAAHEACGKKYNIHYTFKQRADRRVQGSTDQHLHKHISVYAYDLRKETRWWDNWCTVLLYSCHDLWHFVYSFNTLK